MKHFLHMRFLSALLLMLCGVGNTWAEDEVLYYETFGDGPSKNTSLDSYNSYSNELTSSILSGGWKVSKSNASSTTNYAQASAGGNIYGGNNSSVIFNFGTRFATKSNVKLYLAYRKGSGNKSANNVTLKFSGDGGKNWSEDQLPANTSGAGWYYVNLDVSPKYLSDLQIQISNTSSNGQEARVDDIKLVSTASSTKSNLATFEWSASTANPFIDGEAPTFTAEYTAGNPVPANLITFSSTDPDVAEVVNGVVVMKKAGTTTLSASFAGDDDYNAHAAVNYELTVRLHNSTALYFKDADNQRLEDGAAVSFELNSEYTLPTLNVPTGYEIICNLIEGDEDFAAISNAGEITLLHGTSKAGTATFKVLATREYWNDQTVTLTVKVTKALFEASFSKSEITFDMGTQEEFYAPTLNVGLPEGIEYLVEYASSDEDVLMVDEETGDVVIAGVGTATVTATIVADGYEDATAEYTVTVVNSLKGGSNEVTFDFSSSEGLSAIGLTQPESGKALNLKDTNLSGISNEDVVLTWTDPTGTNYTRIFYSTQNTYSELRIYSEGSINISVPQGCTITSISAEAVKYQSSKETEVDLNDYKVANTSTDNSWNFNFNVQVRIKTLTVTYQSTAGDRMFQTLTVGAGGISSFSTKNALDFSDAQNISAYIATSVEERTVKLQKVTGTVAGNTGLLIVGEEGATEDIPLVEVGTNYSGSNMLKSLYNGQTLAASKDGANNYVFGALTSDESRLGFIRLTSSITNTTGKNLAYLESAYNYVPSATSTKGLTIKFGDDTTGINTVETADGMTNGAIYNLAGQKVDANYKGIVIKNGKKYMNK